MPGGADPPPGSLGHLRQVGRKTCHLLFIQMDIWISRLGICSNDPATWTGLVGNQSLFALWLLPRILAIISEKSSVKGDRGRGDQVLA